MIGPRAEDEYIAPPKKQDKRKKFKLEKPAPAQIEEQSVQSSVQGQQLTRAEPPPDQSFKRQTPPYRPPPGAPPGKAPPRGADGHSQPPPIRAAPPTSKDHPVAAGKRPTRPEQPHEDP